MVVNIKEFPNELHKAAKIRAAEEEDHPSGTYYQGRGSVPEGGEERGEVRWE